MRSTKSFMQFKEPPKTISMELAALEALAEYQQWLRGVLSVLAIAAFILSLVTIEDVAISGVVYAIITVLSICGEIAIFRVYVIKAKHAGISNPIYRHQPSVIHSPHFFQMLFEMFVWALHCPPGMEGAVSWAYALNFFIVLRFYVFVLYLNNVSFAHRIFCRAMSVLSKIPLDTSYYIRTSFAFSKTKTSLAVLIVGWSTLALLYSKAEGIGFWDSIYFTFVTAATIGYGDIVPYTTVGRFIAFFSWIFGLTIVGWVVGMMHDSLALNEAESNLYTLFRANELCNIVPEEAAIVVQRWWRTNKAKKQQKSIFFQNIGAYFFTKQCFLFRQCRRELRQHEAAFVNNLDTYSTAEVGASDSPEVAREPPQGHAGDEKEYAALIGTLDSRLSQLESVFADIERLAEALVSEKRSH